MSRQNTVPKSDNPTESVSALIPLWDMFNHHNSKLSTDYVKLEDACVCYADGDYATGDQAFIFYGTRTNAEFLVHNGFVDPGNEHDALKIRLGVSRSDSQYALRNRLLQTLSLPALAEFDLSPGPSPIDGDLLAFVRIFNMDQKTLNDWIEMEEKHCLKLKQLDSTLDSALETKCWEFLQVRINLLMKQYPALPENTDKLSKFQQLARTKIQLELDILENALEYVKEHLNVILKSD